jgi:hypothetical protein
MTTTPAKEKRKEEKDNIFVDMLYNIVVYIPVLVISWIWEKVSD